MLRFLTAASLAALAFVVAPGASTRGAVAGVAQIPTPHLDVQKLGDGVYAAIRKDAPGLIFNCNSVFIVNDDDVVVVDTNATPTSARETLAALRTITTKPVRTVINTHWHDDHSLGNGVFRSEFPAAAFIGHASALDEIPAAGAATRRQMLDLAPRMLAQLQISIDQQKSLGGGTLTDEERASYSWDMTAIEQYTAEASLAQIVPPTRTLTDRMTLSRGARTIELRYLGRGHTSSDIVVFLPQDRIVVAGDLVTWPAPILGSSSHPLDFPATLGNLIALDPAIIVPGHGPVIRDMNYVKQSRRLLESLKRQVEASVARGDAIDETRRSVQLDEFKKDFVHDSPLLSYLFDSYLLSSGVPAAYRDAKRAPSLRR